MSKDTDAYYKRWHRNMWTGSSSAINWNTSPTGGLSLTWRITAGCRRFILIVSISKLGDLWRMVPPLQMFSAASASYVDQILKGASPGKLPIYLASRFELLINLTTAKSLGLSIPPSLLLLTADEVTE